jgi:hypothetical protein
LLTHLVKKELGICVALHLLTISGKLFKFCQFSNNASETINSKRRLKGLARQEGIAIKKYHADNGILGSNAFKGECDILKQEYSFGGVGTHHQNGMSERNIKTVSQWVRANMLHFTHHWPSQANVQFWLQAIEYLLWVFSWIPNMHTGLSPNEIWSSCCAPTEEFNWSHVFGCPVHVLDAKL